MTAYQVVHNEEKNRFEVNLEGHLAALDYMLRGDRIVFTHTGVPAPLEGRGIGAALARAGLDFARDAGLVVVPSCPFVRTFIMRHSEYQDLVRK